MPSSAVVLQLFCIKKSMLTDSYSDVAETETWLKLRD